MPTQKMLPETQSASENVACNKMYCPCPTHGGWVRHFLRTTALLLGCAVAIYGIVYLDALTTYQNRKTRFVGRADRQERSITVSGYGKVVGTNDVAMTTIGYSNVDKDVTAARQANKRVMDSVVMEIKKLGISDIVFWL